MMVKHQSNINSEFISLEYLFISLIYGEENNDTLGTITK